MIKYSLIFTLSFCWLAAKTFAQPHGANPEVEKWLETNRSIVVSKNDGQLIPIKDLGHRTIYWHTFGLERENAFEKTLQKYASPPTLPPSVPGDEINIFGINSTAFELE